MVLNPGLKVAFQVSVQVVTVDRGELDRKVDLSQFGVFVPI